MQFERLGFAGFLLPLSILMTAPAGRRTKSALLLVVSLIFTSILFPESIRLLIISLLPDMVCAFVKEQKKHQSFYEILFYLAMAKNLVMVTLFCIVLPLVENSPPPVGLTVVCLFSACALVEQRRGRLTLDSSVDFASSAMFFGALPLGPISPPAYILSQISKPSLSARDRVRALMRFILGLFKHVVLTGQLSALLKTLARLDADEISMASAWLCALCAAMLVYFYISSAGDIAAGLAGMFGLKLSNLCYYPFQAAGPREYIYRLNMPLEEALGRLCSPNFEREEVSGLTMAVTVLTCFSLGLMLDPSPELLLWSLWLSGVAVCARMLKGFKHFVPLPAARILTFFCCLPAYVFLIPCTFDRKMAIFLALMGINVNLFNDPIAYLALSNLVLLVGAPVLCTGLVETLGRLTRRQFPRFWWVSAPLGYAALAALTLSFLMWNAR
jgi:hypothetical protein